MELVLIACAESAAIDMSTQRVSLFNLLEEIGAASFPVILPHVSLISIFPRRANESENPSLQLRVTLDGQKQALFEAPLEVQFQGKLRARNLTSLQGMPIPSTGLMKVEIRSKSRVLGTWNVQVGRIGQQQVTRQLSPSKEAPAKIRSRPSSKAKPRGKKSAK